MYSYCFPMTIALLRYLFVVHSLRVKAVGMVRVVELVIALSILIPLWITLSHLYPVSDFIHGPYNHCMGRFEVFFNPYHPDTITEGEQI